MKSKLLFLIAMMVTLVAYSQDVKQEPCVEKACCDTIQCDSINMSVVIIDGMERRNSDPLPDANDIESIEIIKDPAITRIFKPRLGGIVLITTKSKKNLKSILDDYHKNYEPYQPVEVTPDIDTSKIWVK